MTGNTSLDAIAAQYDEPIPVSDGYLREREPDTGEEFGYDG